MADCKWMQDEICVNDQCPMCADYCPVPDGAGVCRYEEREGDCKQPQVTEPLRRNGFSGSEESAASKSGWISAEDRPPEEWRDEDGNLINYMAFMPEYGVDIGNYLKPAKSGCARVSWQKLPTGCRCRVRRRWKYEQRIPVCLL